MDEPEPVTLPRVAVFHGHGSASPLTLAEAASGICQILWIVDTSEEEVEHDVRLLRKIGPVVDAAGLTSSDATRRVAAYRPAGVTVFFDAKIMEASLLAAELGLPFNSPETATDLTDKLAQRSALAAAGLPCPRFWQLPAEMGKDAVEDLAREVAYPAVVKPERGSGSQDTCLVADAAALLRDCGHAGRGEDLLVEEYLPDHWSAPGEVTAPYVSVESIVSRGIVSHLALTGRFPVAEPFRETGFFIPGNLPAGTRTAVLDLAERSARALGVTHGCLNTEVKLTPDGPRIVEVNGRPGGGTATVLRLASGVSLLPLVFRLALGEHIEIDSPLPCPRIGYLFYRQPPISATRVVAIDGLDHLRALSGVASVTLRHGVNQPVDWRMGITSYVFSVEGSVTDEQRLIEIYRFANKNVKIVFDA